MKPEEIARVCHEVNRAYCNAIGDYSQPTWEDAPDWQKDSCVDGVGFALREGPSASPDVMHANWMRHKQEDGWKWGPEKDAEKKTHPCMVPYDDLPQEQRAKNAIFSAIVQALA